MRANTKKKHEIGKRFAVLIGVAAVGVLALGAQTVMAQTAAQPPAVVKYDTTLTITHDGGFCRGGGASCVDWHGGVESDRSECVGGRRVILFKKQPGADRKLGAVKSEGDGGWEVPMAPWRGRVYARVSPKVGDGFVCRADRSLTITNGKLRDKEQLPTT